MRYNWVFSHILLKSSANACNVCVCVCVCSIRWLWMWFWMWCIMDECKLCNHLSIVYEQLVEHFHRIVLMFSFWTHFDLVDMVLSGILYVNLVLHFPFANTFSQCIIISFPFIMLFIIYNVQCTYSFLCMPYNYYLRCIHTGNLFVHYHFHSSSKDSNSKIKDTYHFIHDDDGYIILSFCL